ncbi:MAG: hypothetical protein JO328_18825 [Hyphomicrobiales bacterium]|nr:hypothetical protein [Hyphomicrobiales bacterium]MBV8825469.1 hypothetical protein [Hyphomicrobiales bacterium]MBV9429481.1 hypothetical protein [Bradyrhizobiaceae bacterium]
MEFTWGNLLTLAATTGVVTALLNQGVGALREWWSSSKKNTANARYLSLRIAVLLERYADTCYNVAAKIDLYQSSRGHDGDQITKVPEVPDYPVDDDGWKLIAPDLLGRSLSFPNKVIASQKVVDAVPIWGDLDDLVQQCMEETLDRGLEAWNLAGDLRKRYRFEPQSHVYDYADHLRELKDAVSARRKRQEEMSAVNIA